MLDVKWEPYNKLHVANYKMVHYDTKSDVVVLQVMSKENTFTRAILSKFLADSNELLRIRDKENNPIHAHFAGITHQTLRGLDPRINPDKPPRNFRDAMKALDNQAWAAAYNSEYIGFQQRKVFKIVRPEPKWSNKCSPRATDSWCFFIIWPSERFQRK